MTIAHDLTIQVPTAISLRSLALIENVAFTPEGSGNCTSWNPHHFGSARFQVRHRSKNFGIEKPGKSTKRTGFIRLFVKGVFTGFKRGLRNQEEHTAILKLENVNCKEDTTFYLERRSRTCTRLTVPTRRAQNSASSGARSPGLTARAAPCAPSSPATCLSGHGPARAHHALPLSGVSSVLCGLPSQGANLGQRKPWRVALHAVQRDSSQFGDAHYPSAISGPRHVEAGMGRGNEARRAMLRPTRCGRLLCPGTTRAGPLKGHAQQNSPQGCQKFIRDKYERKRWYSEDGGRKPASSKPPPASTSAVAEKKSKPVVVAQAAAAPAFFDPFGDDDTFVAAAPALKPVVTAAVTAKPVDDDLLSLYTSVPPAPAVVTAVAASQKPLAAAPLDLMSLYLSGPAVMQQQHFQPQQFQQHFHQAVPQQQQQQQFQQQFQQAAPHQQFQPQFQQAAPQQQFQQAAPQQQFQQTAPQQQFQQVAPQFYQQHQQYPPPLQHQVPQQHFPQATPPQQQQHFQPLSLPVKPTSPMTKNAFDPFGSLI
ncbi:hypothetical protein BASA81_005180 [Batrachochytrium salamandrivorans]|nr:hypothetical protein BASA81_005180 [Batrachochytrium salamandrivorans]